MQQQHFPVFTVTPRGLMMNGMPLTKSASHNLPPQTLREIAHIETLLKKVKKEEWNNPIPYAGGEYPVLVQAGMKAALLSPQPFPPAPSKPLAKGFNPDEPRDERGRWTTGGPSFASLKSNYPTYKQYPSKPGDNGGKTIWQLIGGQIEKDHANDPNFSNSCAIRISYTLNQSGDNIDKDGNKTVSGADGSWYYYRISDLTNYITQAYGKPDEYSPNTWKSDVSGQTGIVLFKVPFSDATGHLELFDGKNVLNYDDPDPNAHHDYTDRATHIFFWPVK